MPETPAATPSEEAAPQKPPPNYAARRMLVTTVAIVAVVAFAVIGWQVVRSDDDGIGGGGGDWSEIALVAPNSGAITVVDGSGEVVSTVVGRGRVTDVQAIGSRLALIGPTQIVIEGDGDATAIPVDRADTVVPVRTPDALHLVIGEANGGNVIVADVVTGELIDIGLLARNAEPQIFADPLMFAGTVRWSDDASRFAVADASSFQTIVVSEGSEEVAFFGSQPVALSDDRIATSQTIGGQADVEIFDDDRDSKARVPTPIPAGGVMVDDDLLMVSIDGGVYRVESGETEARKLGQVAVPSGATVAAVAPSLDGERLVVSGGVFEAVIDLEGRTLFTTTFTSPVEIDNPVPDWTCIAVGGGETYHSLVALETGEQLADLSGAEVIDASTDGCTVLVERAGVAEVISTDGVVSLGRVRSATLGPDGRTVVWTTTSGTTQIIAIDDDLQLGDPVDIVDAPMNAVVAFLE